MFGRIRFSRLMLIAGSVLGLSFVAVALLNALALEKLRVGGPLYSQIVLGKDLIADILPPPAYVLEAYLETTLALNDPQSTADHANRLAQLHKEYDTRQEYWLQQDLVPHMKELLTSESHTHVVRFWTEVESKFLPSLKRGDIEAARISYSQIQDHYTKHRAIIDQVVVAATKSNQQIEAGAASEETAYTAMVWSLEFGTLLLVLAILYVIRSGMIKPMVEMAQITGAVAKGDTELSIPGTGRRDEIGDMARAVDIFKQKTLEIAQLREQQIEQEKQARAGMQTALERLAEAVESQLGSAIAGTAKRIQAVGVQAAEMLSSASRVSATAASVNAATEQARGGRQRDCRLHRGNDGIDQRNRHACNRLDQHDKSSRSGQSAHAADH